jgi:outer membrane protein
MNKSSLSNKLYPLILLAIGLLFCVLYVNFTKPKIGYVVIQEVFNDFELKKELQKKLENVKNYRQKIVDSLRIDLTILSKKVQTNSATPIEKDLFERKKIEYNQKLQIFEEDNGILTKQYDQEIITQLNQYIKDYGKKNNFDMIQGNNSDGSLMYGKEEFNLTKEVSVFINEKYKGVK